MRLTRALGWAALAAGGTAGAYVGFVTGAITVDLGLGRRIRPLGPIEIEIAAPRQVVYDMATAPYVRRPTTAMREKVQVLERGDGMVLAAHRTPIGRRLTAVTIETVRFDPPGLIAFRLLRGPVPHVTESFTLIEVDADTTRLVYAGELGTDLWGLGARWGALVGGAWERTVDASLGQIKTEAERRR